MRILIACGASRRPEGGVAGVVHNLARELRALGHSVDCWFHEDLLPSRRLPARFETIDLAMQIAHRIRNQARNFDVVNIHAPFGFVYGMWRHLIGRRVSPPYVMTMHGLEERRIHTMRHEARKGRASHFNWKNRIWHRAYHMPTYRYSILTADHSIVLNREAWSCVQFKYRRDSERVWYVPNGVEQRYFLPREYRQDGALRLLYAGTWLDHKGVFYLVEAFEALAQRMPSLRLTIAGCLSDAAVIRENFSGNLRDHVEVLPFVPAAQMPSIYAQHHIFLFPSLMEGMPLVLLEAMASGMPVVTTDSCGMADVVEHGHNGLLVKPADTPGIVESVTRLAESPELRARVGRAAQESMRRYTWDRIARQVEKIFALAVTPESVRQREELPSRTRSGD